MELLPVESFGNLSERDCIRIQTSLISRVQQTCTVPLNLIRTVGGVDLAYWKDDYERAVCCIVIIDVQSGKILDKTYSAGIIEFPYIPGCLSFRELPLVMEGIKTLGVTPDIFMFDGNGILHPRRMGLATFASFYLGRPTLGVAKTYYKINNTPFEMPENKVGSYTDIVINNELLGRAVRTQIDVKPVFVSIGNNIDIDTATSLTVALTGPDSHIPIPTRYADLETHVMRRTLWRSGQEDND